MLARQGAGTGMTFVGRRDLLSVLDEELQRALGGTPRLVLVEGPAGIGKSALLREFLDQSAAAVEPATAMGDVDEREITYGYVEQILGAGALPFDHELSTGMVEVGRRLVSLFDELQVEDVGIVVLEDVHWADLPSLRALAFALCRLHADRIMAILTARSNELSWVPGGLLRIVHDTGTRIEVPPLDVDEAEEIAAQAGVADLPRSRVGSWAWWTDLVVHDDLGRFPDELWFPTPARVRGQSPAYPDGFLDGGS